MIEENQQLVKDALVEFQKQSVEVHQDCRKITHHFKGIYRIYPNLIKENRRMSTCNRLDLQTLGSQPVIMPKNLPNHCWWENRERLLQFFFWFKCTKGFPKDLIAHER